MDFKIISSDKFSPLQDLIVVKPYAEFGGRKEEEVTECGLILALSKEKSVVNDRPVYGKVISCGDKCTVIKQGMEIFWDVTRGHDIVFKDGEFMILMEETVLGYRNSEESE